MEEYCDSLLAKNDSISVKELKKLGDYALGKLLGFYFIQTCPHASFSLANISPKLREQLRKEVRQTKP